MQISALTNLYNRFNDLAEPRETKTGAENGGWAEILLIINWLHRKHLNIQLIETVCEAILWWWDHYYYDSDNNKNNWKNC